LPERQARFSRRYYLPPVSIGLVPPGQSIEHPGMTPSGMKELYTLPFEEGNQHGSQYKTPQMGAEGDAALLSAGQYAAQ